MKIELPVILISLLGLCTAHDRKDVVHPFEASVFVAEPENNKTTKKAVEHHPKASVFIVEREENKTIPKFVDKGRITRKISNRCGSLILWTCLRQYRKPCDSVCVRNTLLYMNNSTSTSKSKTCKIQKRDKLFYQGVAKSANRWVYKECNKTLQNEIQSCVAITKTTIKWGRYFRGVKHKATRCRIHMFRPGILSDLKKHTRSLLTEMTNFCETFEVHQQNKTVDSLTSLKRTSCMKNGWSAYIGQLCSFRSCHRRYGMNESTILKEVHSGLQGMSKSQMISGLRAWTNPSSEKAEFLLNGRLSGERMKMYCYYKFPRYCQYACRSYSMKVGRSAVQSETIHFWMRKSLLVKNWIVTSKKKRKKDFHSLFQYPQKADESTNKPSGLSGGNTSGVSSPTGGNASGVSSPTGVNISGEPDRNLCRPLIFCQYSAYKNCKQIKFSSCTDCSMVKVSFFISLILCLGLMIVIGNILVIWTVWMERKFEKTNAQIFKFSLALTDLLSGLFIFLDFLPNVVWTLGHTSEELHKMLKEATGSIKSSIMSILFLMCFLSNLYQLSTVCFMRLYAVISPWKAMGVTYNTNIRIVIITWIVALLGSALPLCFPSTFAFTLQHDFFIHWLEILPDAKHPNLYILILAVFILIPYISMTGCTLATLIVVLRKLDKSRELTSQTESIDEKEKMITRNMSIMIFGFTITTVPFVVMLLMFNHSEEIGCVTNTGILLAITFYLFYSRSLVNVLVYLATDQSFRDQLRGGTATKFNKRKSTLAKTKRSQME